MTDEISQTFNTSCMRSRIDTVYQEYLIHSVTKYALKDYLIDEITLKNTLFGGKFNEDIF